MTLDKCLGFLREFQLKRDRVEDRTPQEEHKLLLENLPLVWKRKVMEEEAKRRKGRWLVRLTNIPSKPPLLLQNDLQNAIGCVVDKVVTVNNGFVIHCSTENIQKQILELNGWLFEGSIVRTSRMESQITTDEIGQHVTEKWDIKNSVQELHQRGRKQEM